MLGNPIKIPQSNFSSAEEINQATVFLERKRKKNRFFFATKTWLACAV
jgi:hypothetical protein